MNLTRFTFHCSRGQRVPFITDGYGTSYQPPSTIKGWNYLRTLIIHASENCVFSH